MVYVVYVTFRDRNSVYGCLHVIYVVVIGNGKDVFVLNEELN